MLEGKLKAAGPENGNVANRLKLADSPVHHWYRFVLSFPPHLVRRYLEDFEIGRNEIVLDPFCGTGTTLVECKKHGIRSVGIEALPMTYFASKTKTDWTGTSPCLIEHANSISDLAASRLEAKPSKHLSDLGEAVNKLILKNSISSRPLAKSLVLHDTLKEHFGPDSSVYRDYLELALATTLVQDASNLHFGPEVGVRGMKDDAPVIHQWLHRVKQFADDLTSVSHLQNTETLVLNTDARDISNSDIEPESISAIITSPPYPNEKDYTRITRLESVLLGFVHDNKQLREQKKQLVRSNTRGVYKADTDHLATAGIERVESLASEIEARRLALNKTSGFEKNYATVVRQYFGGMMRHLQNLKAVLKPGALLAYVVGDQASFFQILIKTGDILAHMGEELGYEHVRTDLFRTRLATATRVQLREEVVVLRWLGD